jgi:predicted GH43/DUF377 family glycosyl hydrolase
MVFNAGVVKLPEGDTLLFCGVEDRRGLSHLCAARSANGIDNWRIDPQRYSSSLSVVEDQVKE